MGAVGSLVVKVGADISGIQRDAQRGAQSLGALQKGAGRLGMALKAMAVGLVARQMTNMVRNAMDAIDTTAKLSRQLGGTINGLQGLRHAAAEAGVGSGALEQGLQMLNRRLGEAARVGAGQAHDALQRLGISAKDLSGMDLDERMATISDAMAGAGWSTQQMSDLLGQLGIRSGEMIRLMADGGDAIRGARQQIDRMGLSLSAVEAAQVEAANDAMLRLKKTSGALAQKIAVGVSPFLTAMADQLVSMAADSDSLASSVTRAGTIIAKVVGFIGDVMRGLHIVFKSLELGGWALNTAFIMAFRGIHKGISIVVDAIVTGPINRFIEALNQLPGIEITPLELAQDGSMMKALDEAADAAAATTAAIAREIKELATSEWPSANIEAFLAKVAEAGKKAAEDVKKRRDEMAAAGGGGADSEADQKEAEALQQRLDQQLEMLREHVMSREELEMAAHARRVEQLNESFAAGMIQHSEFASLSEGIEKKHMDELAKIRKAGMDRVQSVSVSSMASGVQTILGMVQSLTAGMARENKTAFDIHKAAAVTSAIISGAQGVAQTYGAFPFPINIPFAVAHAGLAAAQVAIIASKQFKGGSAQVAAPAPSVPSPSAAPSAGGGGALAGGVTGGQGSVVSVNATGDVFSRQTVLALIGEINDAVGDGARIVLA